MKRVRRIDNRCYREWRTQKSASMATIDALLQQTVSVSDGHA